MNWPLAAALVAQTGKDCVRTRQLMSSILWSWANYDIVWCRLCADCGTALHSHKSWCSTFSSSLPAACASTMRPLVDSIQDSV